LAKTPNPNELVKRDILVTGLIFSPKSEKVATASTAIEAREIPTQMGL
jgi:hypothetical protein